MPKVCVLLANYLLPSEWCLAASFAAFSPVSAWTGPTGSPPNNNTDAPINVSATDQIKDGNLGVGGLAVFGNTILGGGIYPDAYLNFGATSGSSGYGIWDDNGILSFKNSGGSWTSLQSIVSSIVNTSNPSYSTSVTAPEYCIGSSCITSWAQATPTWASITGKPYPIDGQVWNWSGQGGQPTWLWGSNDGTNMYVWNPSNFSVNYATNAGNAYSTDGYTFNQWVTAGAAPNFSGIIGLSGNVGIGNVSTGWYSDGSNLAARIPSASGYFAIQTPGGGVAYMSSGPAQGGTFFPTGDVWAYAFLYPSDERLKKDIEPLTDNLAKIVAMQPVSYQWIDPSHGTGEQLGFIAQQVQKIEPELVHTNASTTLESLDYTRITPLLVGAMQELNQELNQKIGAQDQKIDTQQQQIDALQADIAALQNK